MGLYLQIGTEPLPTNTVRVSSRTLRPIEVNRYIVAHEHELSIEGHLYAIGPANLSTVMAALDALVKVPNPDITLVSTDTGATAHTLLNAGSIGGVVVKNFGYTDTPLHMATEAKFSLTATAIYANSALTRQIVSLTETVRIQGDGGPDDVLAQQAGLKSIYQRLADYTDVMVTQSGKIISRSSSTEVPGPIITVAGAKVSRSTTIQKQVRQFGTSILLYEQDYSYTFQLPELPVTPIVPTILT